eukprot:2430937-Prymnesium_polylepis.2
MIGGAWRRRGQHQSCAAGPASLSDAARRQRCDWSGRPCAAAATQPGGPFARETTVSHRNLQTARMTSFAPSAAELLRL